MKTKNIISLLLVLAMLMSVCACGSDTTPAAPNGSAETKPEYRITAKLTAADAENKELAAHLTENCVISFTNTSSDTWDKICLRDYAAANLELENSSKRAIHTSSAPRTAFSASKAQQLQMPKTASEK